MGSRRQNRTTNHTPQNSLERMDWDWLELGEISEDPRLQMRLEGLDEKHVRDLMATVEDNGIEDPIIIVREGKTFWLADGFHRVEAYRRVGGENWRKQRIKATVLTGTFDDAKQLARKANLRHGKPLSPASRKAILFDMVRGEEEINGIPVKRLSNTTLAGELGVHQDTIGEWFKELMALESTGGNPPVAQTDRDIVFDRNGREIRVAEIAATNRRRAEDEQERKRQERLNAEVQAETERLAQFRASNVIFRVKFVAEMFLHSPSNRNIAARLKIDLPSENTPEEDKTFGYYIKAADKRFVLSVERESQFIRDFKSHKDISWYQTLLSVITPAIWEQAESQDWDEQIMQEWLDGYKTRHAAPVPSTAPQPNMAQPKGDAAYPQTGAISRHRLSTPLHTAASTPESKTKLPVVEPSVTQPQKSGVPQERNATEATIEPYRPAPTTQQLMAENYAAFNRSITEAFTQIQAILEFDCNLQYLQSPEVLESLWNSIQALVDQMGMVGQTMFERLSHMASTGLPYDPNTAAQVLREGKQRA